MRTIDIGRLNKRLTFKRLAEIDDDMGQTLQEMAEICTVWGSLYPIRGMEFHEIQKVQSKITHKCYIRFREDIDTECYISYDGKDYIIEAVIDVDLDHKILEIMCAEYTNKEVIE